MPSVAISELFEEERNKGISVFTGGRMTIDFTEIERSEKDAVRRALHIGAELLNKVSPTLAKDFLDHESVFLKFAGVAKAHFPESKPITFPSQAGTIGVNFIFPAAIKYAATASSTYPCYTSYSTNSWNISLTAGTAAYLFGDGSNFYKASPTTSKHELIVIMQNGVIEIGTSPSIYTWRLWTEAETKYGVYAAHPLIDVEYEEGKTVYRYPTLGVIPIYHDFGIMWGFMPYVSKTANIRLVGMVFYEHDLFPDLSSTYVT